jgi:glutathionylspermidine synthase
MRTVFDHYKWDAQCGDTDVLTPFPIFIKESHWRELAALAERLAAELVLAQAELLARPKLHALLGLPQEVRRYLAKPRMTMGSSPKPIQITRFDFHWTTEEWRISEANTDVPGGYIEAGGFTRLMAEHYPSRRALPDPAERWAEAVADRLGPGALVALVHATSYTDDRQVMMYLSRHLAERGLRVRLVGPQHLTWTGRGVTCDLGKASDKVDAIIRFFPADWLSRIRPFPAGLFAHRDTLLVNPGTMILTQSKRFPLTWDHLQTPLPTWRALLPGTRDPRDVDWRHDEQWMLKPVWGREGSGVHMRGVTTPAECKSIEAAVKRFPEAWVAQRRFDALPLMIDGQSFYPCLGVYTINGKAAGIFGRIASHPLIDGNARDVAVLVDPEENLYGS